MKVYGIFYGEYSDWNVVGFYTNREEAEKRCAELYGEYIIELHCLDGSVKVTDDKLHYCHEVVFDNTADGWKMRKEPTRYTYHLEKENYPTIQRSWWIGTPWIAVKVWLREGVEGRDKAEKIAQDKLYEYLAQEEGVV